MKDTRQLTETALLLLVFILLFAVTFFLPLLGTLLVWFLPFPFIMNAVRNGRNATVAMVVGALILSLFFSVAALPIAWTFASAGFVIGEMFRRNKPQFHILLAGSLTYIANFVLLYILLVVVTGTNPIADSIDAMKSMFKDMQTISGLPTVDEEQMKILFAQLDLVTYLVPSMLIMAGLLFALLTQLISGFILKRLQYDVTKWKPFSEWSFPRSLIFYYLIVLILSLVGLEEGSTLFVLVANLDVLLGNAMVLQGFTVIFAFSKMKQWSKAVPVLITVFSFLLMFPLQFVKLLGILDLGLNLRSRMNVK